MRVAGFGFRQSATLESLQAAWLAAQPAGVAAIAAPDDKAQTQVFAAFAAVTLISPLSVLAITAIYALETLVSFIQAYVFAILTCVYLKDALHPHH